MMAAIPDFLIIGAMKAGTTAVAETMARHSQLHIPESKEPHYFIDRDQQFIFHDGRWASYTYGPRSLPEYQDLLRGSQVGCLRGEASTQYLPNPTSPSLVQQENPAVKLIVVLREPVSRAYSAYTYNRAIQHEKARTFEQAIRDELDGKRDSYYYSYRYLHYGRYCLHLKNWIQKFPREQLLILLFEDLKRSPEMFYSKISEFLKVSPFTGISGTLIDNKTSMPANPLQRGVWWLMETPNPAKLFLKKHLNNNRLAAFKKIVKARMITIGDPPAAMDGKMREIIGDYFSQDITALEREFGLNVDQWK